MPRYAALRLIDARTILVKLPNDPCAIILESTDPLFDSQLKMLAVATPWNPVMLEADLGGWNGRAFAADILSIESQMKLPVALKPKRRTQHRTMNPRALRLA